MTDLDELIRDTLSDRAGGAPTEENLLPGMRLRLAARRRRRLALATAAACVAVAGVAAAFVHQSGSSRSTSTLQVPPSTHPTDSSSAHATSASNRRATEHEAARLLRLTPVPPGATAVSHPPPGLQEPMARAGTSSFIDKVKFWRVSMPLDSTLAWIESHRPRELTKVESSSGADRGIADAGIAWSEPDTNTWSQAWLQVLVVSVDSSHSAIRADGTAIWLDPKPAGDNAVGPRVHTTVHDGCPNSDRGVVGVSNTGANLDRQLLPGATPSIGLICQYSGLNPPAFTLTATKHLTQAQAQALSDAVRGIRLAHDSGGGATSCPMDTGTADLIVLHYPSGADVDLFYANTGCQGLSNGHIGVGYNPGFDTFNTTVRQQTS